MNYGYEDECNSRNWETIDSTPSTSVIRPLQNHSYRRMKGRAPTPALKQSFPLRSMINVGQQRKPNTHKRWSLSRHTGKENSPNEIMKKVKMQIIAERSGSTNERSASIERSDIFEAPAPKVCSSSMNSTVCPGGVTTNALEITGLSPIKPRKAKRIKKAPADEVYLLPLKTNILNAVNSQHPDNPSPYSKVSFWLASTSSKQIEALDFSVPPIASSPLRVTNFSSVFTERTTEESVNIDTRIEDESPCCTDKMLLENLTHRSRRKLTYNLSSSNENETTSTTQEPRGPAQPLSVLVPHNENNLGGFTTTNQGESLLKPLENNAQVENSPGNHIELLLKPIDTSTEHYSKEEHRESLFSNAPNGHVHCNNHRESQLGKPTNGHVDCCIMERYGDSLFSTLYQPPKKQKLFKGLFTCEEIEADISNDILTLSFSDAPAKVPLSVFNESAEQGKIDPTWKEIPEDCLKLY